MSKKSIDWNISIEDKFKPGSEREHVEEEQIDKSTLAILNHVSQGNNSTNHIEDILHAANGKTTRIRISRAITDRISAVIKLHQSQLSISKFIEQLLDKILKENNL